MNRGQKVGQYFKNATRMMFGLRWNWTDAKKSFLPRLKIEPRPYVQKRESLFFFFFFFLTSAISLIAPRAYCCCAPTIHATTGLLLRLPCTTTSHCWVSFPTNATTIHDIVVHDAELRWTLVVLSSVTIARW